MNHKQIFIQQLVFRNKWRLQPNRFGAADLQHACVD